MSWYIEAGPESDYIVSSRVRLARNLRGYPFPNRMDQQQSQDLMKDCREAFFSLNERMHEDFLDIKLEELSAEEQLALVEKRLISEDLLRHASSSGAIISRDESVAVMFDEEDHIRIQAMAPGLNLDSAYEQAQTIARLFEERLPVAYDEQYGFLTACPTNTGTGLRASVMIHLPALTELGQIRTLSENLQKLGFAVRGNYGENTEASGCLYQISNQITLGLSEADLISDLLKTVEQTIDIERKARRQLYIQQPLKTEDRISRALATLKAARLMPSQEALQLISDVRLGVELGILDSVTPEEVNRMMTSVGPGTIQKLAGHQLSTEERDAHRARLLQEILLPKNNSPDNGTEDDRENKTEGDTL